MADPLVDRVVRVLRAKEWLVEADESPGGLRLAPSDGEAPWPVVARVGPDDAQVAVYSLWPAEVPAERRDAVVELVTAANLDRTIGSFEIDASDGDLRFRTSIDLGSALLDDDQLAALVAPLVHHNLTAMDEWWDALTAVVDGADPVDVVG